MKRMLGIPFLLILATLVNGCSGYQVACTSLADLSPDRNQEFSSACELEPGDRVRINLKNGNTMEGIIEELSITEISLAVSPESDEPRRIAGDRIRSIEKKSASAGRTTMGFLVIAGVLVAFGVGLANWSMF